MSELPTPAAFGLPQAAVIAVPPHGLTVYRLVRSDPPTPRDFELPSPQLAAIRGWPELLRAGFSHSLTPERAERVRRSPVSRIAEVELRAGTGTYVARTGRTPGHVTVWARLEAGGGGSRLSVASPTIPVMTVFSLFSGADVIAEFDSRAEAQRALEDALAAKPSARAELAIFEFDETGEGIGPPLKHAVA